METKTLQVQIDRFYEETGYRLKIKDGNVYYDGCLDLEHIKITELPDNLVVGRNLGLYNTNIAKLPDNLVVGGGLYLGRSKVTQLPDNLVVGGNLDLYCTKITKLPDNLVVGGNLDLYGTKITKLPDNLVVGDSLYLHNTNVTKLPETLIVGNTLDIRHTKITELPDNLAVGANLYLRDSKVTELPDNLLVGGTIFGMSSTPISLTLSKEAKKILQKINSSIQNIKGFLQWNAGGKTYIKVDGIFSVVDSHKGNVWRTHCIGKEETLYVVTDGEGHYAHGKTLKEAKADLIYKINDRDTSLYENLSLDDEISFEEAIAMYRTITGACAAGTRDFVENRLPEPHKERYTIREVIDLTYGEYGSEKLKKFFKV